MRKKEEIIYREIEKAGLNAENVLIEALPYIQRLADTKKVIKFGGNAMIDEKLKNNFA